MRVHHITMTAKQNIFTITLLVTFDDSQKQNSIVVTFRINGTKPQYYKVESVSGLSHKDKERSCRLRKILEDFLKLHPVETSFCKPELKIENIDWKMLTGEERTTSNGESKSIPVPKQPDLSRLREISASLKKKPPE